MNVVILMGRLCRDPEIRRTQGGDRETVVANYVLAVDRRFKKDGEQQADFIRCVAFGKSAEFAEKHLRKGTKMVVRGRIQTGSYTDQKGAKHYTTDVYVDEQEFAESKKASDGGSAQTGPQGVPMASNPDFMYVPEDMDEELPFN